MWANGLRIILAENSQFAIWPAASAPMSSKHFITRQSEKQSCPCSKLARSEMIAKRLSRSLRWSKTTANWGKKSRAAFRRTVSWSFFCLLWSAFEITLKLCCIISWLFTFVAFKDCLRRKSTSTFHLLTFALGYYFDYDRNFFKIIFSCLCVCSCFHA